MEREGGRTETYSLTWMPRIVEGGGCSLFGGWRRGYDDEYRYGTGECRRGRMMHLFASLLDLVVDA